MPQNEVLNMLLVIPLRKQCSDLSVDSFVNTILLSSMTSRMMRNIKSLRLHLNMQEC